MEGTMDVAILGAVIAGLFAAIGIVLVNRTATRRRIDHAVRW
jgi:urea transporter